MPDDNEIEKRKAFKELCWSAFILDMYWPKEEKIFLDKDFCDKLRNNPHDIVDEAIQTTLIKEFLNKWKCRVKNSRVSACAIKKCIDKLKPYFQKLHGSRIENAKMADIKPTVEIIYDEIRKSLKAHKFGPTSISKLLHIINPTLFVMWDGNIRDYYMKKNSKIRDSGEGYFTFLEEMQKIAKEIIKDFKNSKLSASTDVASYLNDKLKVSYGKSLARYVDQYNWLFITQREGEGILPIKWHPDKEIC